MMKEFSFDDLLTSIKKRKSLSLAVLMVILVVAGVVALIIPQAQAIMDNREELAAEKKKLTQLREKLAQLDRIKYDPSYFESTEIVNLALQDHKPLLEFLASLDQVTRATEIEVTDLELNPGALGSESAKISSKNQKSGVDGLPVSFRISGSFEKASEFMELLEKIAPFTTINSFSVSEGRARSRVAQQPVENEEEDKVNIEMSCQSYFANVTANAQIGSPVPVLDIKDLEILEQLKEFQKIELPEQLDIQGGLEDLFGLPSIEEIYSSI